MSLSFLVTILVLYVIHGQARDVAMRRAQAQDNADYCSAAATGATVRTSQSLNIRYSYEAFSDLPSLRVGFAVENEVKKYLEKVLILEGSCRQHETGAVGWYEDVRAVAIGGSTVQATGWCFSAHPEVENVTLTCHSMMSSNTINLRDDAEDVDIPTMSQRLLEVIERAFMSNLLDLSMMDGVYSLSYIPRTETAPTISGLAPTQTPTIAPLAALRTDENTIENTMQPTSDPFQVVPGPPTFTPKMNDEFLGLSVTDAILIGVAILVLAMFISCLITRRSRQEDRWVNEEEELNFRDDFHLSVVSGEDTSESDDEDEAERKVLRSKRKKSTKHNPANPFALREGSALSWSGVSMTLVVSEKDIIAARRPLLISFQAAQDGKNNDRKILDGASGKVPKRCTTAIMGASGAGKTSLLNILAGRVASRGRVRVEADIRIDDEPFNPRAPSARHLIAFVAQDDALPPTSTPREAIRFSARLRLPATTTNSQIDDLTDTMLRELGLSRCADTVVGGPLLKGLSGGERKRTSVGVELVVKPAIVFLDEPTSGLDSFSALRVCQALKKVARAGASVLFTIHQPASEIFAFFDHLLLLHSGRVMYKGPAVEVTEYFSIRGYPCPATFNPADWIMCVSQENKVEVLETHGFFPHRATDESLFTNIIDGDESTLLSVYALERNGKQADLATKLPRVPGFFTQTWMQLRREFITLSRDSSLLVPRLIQTAVLGALIGAIFFEVGETSPADQTNLQSRFGAITICATIALVGTGQASLIAFPEERPIFLREFSTKHYSVSSYFVAHFVMEALLSALQMGILGVIIFYMVKLQGTFYLFYATIYTLAMTSTALAAVVSAAVGGNSELALQFIILLFMPQLLFVGYFVTPNLIPFWLRWVQYISPAAYAVRLILVDEFYDCSSNAKELNNCQLLLDSANAREEHTEWYWYVLGAEFLFFRLVALMILRVNAAKV